MSSGAVREQRFTIEHGDEPGRRIRGVVVRPPGAGGGGGERLPAVLVVHGFKGFLRWGFFPELHRRLARRGLAAVAVNLSGSGVGEDLETFDEDLAFERSTPSRDLEDLELVRRHLDEGRLGELDTARLGALGHSRGGASVLLHAAARRDYRALVTWAATARTVRFPPETVARWRQRRVVEIENARTGKVHRLGVGWLEDAERNAARLDVPAACARLATPTLLVHGIEDEAVPYEEVELLYRAFRPGLARLLAIEPADEGSSGAGHTFGAVHPWRGAPSELERVLEASVAFLEEHLSPGNARVDG